MARVAWLLLAVGLHMERLDFEHDRTDARSALDRGQRASEAAARLGVDSRNSQGFQVNLLDAEIDDLSTAIANLETAKKNLESEQFGWDDAKVAAARQGYDAQIAEYSEQMRRSMRERSLMLQKLSGRPGMALPLRAPQPTAGGNDPVSTLRSQAEQAIAAGADPAAVSARFQQAFSQMVGQSLGNTSKDRGYGHR